MVKRKILVIDDDSFWLRLLARILGSADYDVHTAASCEDGVRMAENHEPDCILLDFHQKDGDAVAVCSALRNCGKSSKCPVIVVSSDPGAERTAYTECQADYFVLKGSHSMLELPNKIRELLGNTERAG